MIKCMCCDKPIEMGKFCDGCCQNIPQDKLALISRLTEISFWLEQIAQNQNKSER